MFLDETIDPEIPTDPNELALYRKYGKNWRNVAMGSTMRDRGGAFDRGMRFMHTTPEGFLQRPNFQTQQQVQQGNIDQSGYFAQMQQLQNEYNRALQEYYSLMGTTQYNQMQDYYQGNYEDLYGAGGGSQDSQYSAAVQEASTTAPSTGSTAISKTPAPALLPPAAARFEPVEAGPTMSDQFIPRFSDRGDSLFGGYGKPAEVKPAPNMVRPTGPTVTPVTAVKKPTTTKKVKAI